MKNDEYSWTTWTSQHLTDLDVPPPLTAQELGVLLPIAQNPNHPDRQKVVDEIFFRNIRIVEGSISGFLNRDATSQEDLAEAYQTACEGLIAAIFTCDLERPEGFYKLAKIQILNRLSVAKRSSTSHFYLSKHSYNRVKKVAWAVRCLQDEGVDAPSWQQISERVYEQECEKVLEQVRQENSGLPLQEINQIYADTLKAKNVKPIPPEKVGVLLPHTNGGVVSLENETVERTAPTLRAQRHEENPDVAVANKTFMNEMQPVFDALPADQADAVRMFLLCGQPETADERKLLRAGLATISADLRHLLPAHLHGLGGV